MSALPTDQNERQRFAHELDRNFSIIAAAGAGKTTAITERIVQIAKKKPDWLPRLVVVTFTNRAADEMQQRARQLIFDSNVPVAALAGFNRAFFGTIHSFCTKLLTAYGHHLGLPSRLELISDDEELWNDFVQRTDSVADVLSPENRKAMLRHVQLRDLMELGRTSPVLLQSNECEPDGPPRLDLARLRHFQTRAGSTRIEALKKALGDWEDQYRSGADFVPLIECIAEGRFREQWQETFAEFNQWLSCCALKITAAVQQKYRQFRAERGVVTFDDQIALALELTRLPEVVSKIRAKDYIVILDEAQDTDPQQFSILTEISRPENATGRWIESLKDPPRSGRFCMVGDFQQSIYKDRADLRQYRRVHEALIKSERGEQLTFSVTFRLDQQQIDFVNECFAEILNEEDQVGFIELSPRPYALPGQVVRLDLTPNNLDPEAGDLEKGRIEADLLGQWLAETGLGQLRARSWDRVAVLCPRKKWFRPIADALRGVGIDSQIQSETDIKADSPAHAWFTALLTIMTQPRCGFEIVGVLREILGISDHDLGWFANDRPESFQIETPTAGSDNVSTALGLLARIHAEVANRALFGAVEHIVDATRLRSRLRALPAEDFENLDHELDQLLQAAADAESIGATLEEFAELLRANFNTERESRSPRHGAIQLITCQKAKGLEWDAVIVPFFSRRVHTADENFPRIIVMPQSQRPMVAFCKADIPADAKDALKQVQRQEMERLLYVALTRARHSLVLVADHQFFAKSDGAAPEASLTTWFRSGSGQINETRVTALATAAESCVSTDGFQVRSARREAEVQQFAFFPEGALPTGRFAANRFSRRYIPSSFAAGVVSRSATATDSHEETEREFRAVTLPSSATRYGVWWHEFIQQVPWWAEAEDWDRVFNEMQRLSPDHGRSAREWKILRKRISRLEDFPPQLSSKAVVVHTEMPFFWRANDRMCLEGAIDFALFNPTEAKWFLLDWKTNEIKPDDIASLGAHYRPQMAGYWRAVGRASDGAVDVAVYSTATGQLIIYTGDELAAEWERLEGVLAETLES